MDWVVAMVYAGFLAGTAALAAIDARTKRLPNRIVFPLYGLGAAGLMLASWLGHEWWRMVIAVGAMALLYGLFWLIGFLGQMGFGDVKLAGLLGLFLGWAGIEIVYAGMLLGTLTAAVVVLTKTAMRRANRKTAIAYGPYLIAGAWAGLAIEAVSLLR